MRPFLLLLVTLGAVACASTVQPSDPGDGGDARADRAVRRDTGDAGRDIPYFDTRVYDVYREDACPGPLPPPMRAYECDPFGQTGCPLGQACYPYIEYPTVRCGAEIYHASCREAGTRRQDDICHTGTECGPGLACFVTGSETRCLQLCRVDGTPPQCPRGRVCEPSDLPDFGACD